jgi:hypothetical protein
VATRRKSSAVTANITQGMPAAASLRNNAIRN